jgi:hypothetical protein
MNSIEIPERITFVPGSRIREALREAMAAAVVRFGDTPGPSLSSVLRDALIRGLSSPPSPRRARRARQRAQ